MPPEIDTRPMWHALMEVQRAIPRLIKNAKGQVGSRVYKYLSLDELMDQILPVLHERGFVLIQPVNFIDGQAVLDTSLIHAESGMNVTSRMVLTPVKDDPQSLGSAITYARRYSLMPLLGLVADEDDDGAAATKPRETKMAQPPDPSKDEDRPADPPVTVDRAREIFIAAQTKGLVHPTEGGTPVYEPIFKALLQSVGKVQRKFISELTDAEAVDVEKWIANYGK